LVNTNSFKKYFDGKLIVKYIKSNFSDSAYSLSNLLIASLDGFFLNILLVRFLTLEDLGNYKIFFAIINILIITSINGLNASVTKAVAKKYRIFFIKATKISTLFSFIGSVILVILAFTYYKSSDIKIALLFASAVIPVYFGFNIWESYLYGEKQFKKILIFNAILAVVRFLVCGLILFFYKNYLFTILAYILIVAVFNVIFYFTIYRKIKYDKVEVQTEKELIKHGANLTGSSTISVIASNVERLILEGVANAATVGIYSIVNIFPSFIKNGLKNLIIVPTVKLAARPEKDNRRILKRAIFILLAVGIIIFVIFWFITPWLLRFFFKVEDQQTILYGQLIMVPIIFLPINLTIKYMASYQGSGSSILKLSPFLEGIKVALFAVFIPFFKINGIIIALVLGEIISFIILVTWFFISNKKFDVK
jgi:O-antigen/teichoic acid export membrane protein